MTVKQIIPLLLSLLGAWMFGGGYLYMQHGADTAFQLYTICGAILWMAAFAHVCLKIEISKMTPEEYTKYKNRPQPESLM